MNQFHEILKSKRIEKGFTQKEVADYLFVSDKTYSQYERGLRNVEIEMFLKLVDFLDIEIENINCMVSVNYLYKQLQHWYEKIGKRFIEKDVTFSFYHSDTLMNKKTCKTLFPVIKNFLQYILYFSQEQGEVAVQTKIDRHTYHISLQNHNDAMTFSEWIHTQIEKGELTYEELDGEVGKENALQYCMEQGIRYTREHFDGNYMKDFYANGGHVYGTVDEQDKVNFTITFPV